jgi:hypothetical protein
MHHTIWKKYMEPYSTQSKGVACLQAIKQALSVDCHMFAMNGWLYLKSGHS